MTTQHTILSHIYQQGDITHFEATELYGIHREEFLMEAADLVFRKMLTVEPGRVADGDGGKKTVYQYTFTDEGRIAWERHPNSNFKPTPTPKT